MNNFSDTVVKSYSDNMNNMVFKDFDKIEIKDIKIHPDHFSEAIVRYYASYSDKLRFGQFMCNNFQIFDSELFYMDNTSGSIDLFTERYLQD